MSQPTQVPRWADVPPGTSNIVEPLESKKDSGWLTGEKPPSQHANWLFNVIYQWVLYLKFLVNEALVWTALHIFNLNIQIGASLIGTEANAAGTPRIETAPASSGTAAYTQIWKAGDMRLWAGTSTFNSTPTMVLTVNTKRDTAGSHKWQKITASAQAIALYLCRDRMILASMPTAQNTDWTDAIIDGNGTTGGWGRIMDIPTDQDGDSTSLANIARFRETMTSTAGVERVLLFEFTHGTLGALRFYYCISSGASDAGGLELTVNAKWDSAGNLWTRDFTAQSSKFIFTQARLAVLSKISGSGTFADTAWDATPLTMLLPTATSGSGDETKVDFNNGRLAFLNTQTAQADDANPPATTAPGGNRLHAKNIPKAWGTITTNSTGTPAIDDGYNVSAVAAVNPTITVTLNTAMQNANYAVIAVAETINGGGGPLRLVGVKAQSTTQFTIDEYSFTIANPSVATSVNLAGVTGHRIYFAVFARQDT